jgi:hypothetical protein
MMRCACRGRAVLSAVLEEGWVTLGSNAQQASCLTCSDAPETHFGRGITRAEIMDYLSQSYGPIFVADLLKRLA